MDKLENLQNVREMYEHSVSMFRIAASSLIDNANNYQKEYKLSKEEIESAKSYGSDFVVYTIVNATEIHLVLTKVKFINDYPYLWGFDEDTGIEYSKIEMPSGDTETTIAVADFLSHVITDLI